GVVLSNPGPRHSCTRHNAGFITAEALEKKQKVSINRLRFRSLTATCEIAGEKVLLMKPQTFMNLSGDAVKPAADFYKVPPQHIIVVSDEMSLPVGRIRVKAKGSAGGHNGLKSIISSLGTEEFPRIRLGVDKPSHADYDVKDWVLSTFKDQDALDIRSAADRAADAIECYIQSGVEKTMNRFNG
ncbi:MAG: aminoacyl-tRNA hydrolase, partial [Clostridia bacterium]|nr:aminoacyl-tRNA hydrolase [Clostridia bacterium]